MLNVSVNINESFNNKTVSVSTSQDKAEDPKTKQMKQMLSEIGTLTDLLFLARRELTRQIQKSKEVVARIQDDYEQMLEEAQ